MKIRKLFTAVASTAALSLSLAFTANAELIKQSFMLESAGVSATVEIAALTENADPTFDTEYAWFDDQIEYISITGLTLPGDPPMDFFFSGLDIFDAFNYLDVFAYLDSVGGPGAENGFFEIVFELNLDVIDFMLDGVVQLVIFNDGFSIDGFYDGFEVTAGPFNGAINVAPGNVQVNTPATLVLMLLSIGGLIVARRK